MINLTDGTPAAPSGKLNVSWQKDNASNVSANIPSPIDHDPTAAHKVLAGPTTGADAQPTMRLLVAGDIPAIPESGVTSLVSDLALKAPLASPTFTGSPAAPTPATADNTTKIATTAYVQAQGYVTSSSSPVASVAGKTGAVTLVEGDIASLTSDLAAKAPLASPALTGTPTAPTASTGTNTTQIATTAFVLAQITSSSGTVTSVALTLPSWLSVSGSPVTTSGTLAVTAATGQTANRFLATPDGSTGTVALRAIAAADLPLATTGSFGAVKPDGTTITVSSGVISAVSAPPAATSFTAITDGSTVTWATGGAGVNNASLAMNHTTGSRTINLTGLVDGSTGTLIVTQDSTGGATIVLGTNSGAYTNKVVDGGGGAITVTSTANAVDILTWVYKATTVYWTYGPNYT